MSRPSLAVLLSTPPESPALWPAVALATAGAVTGLSAGVFAAVQVAILPALKEVDDDAFVASGVDSDHLR